MSINQNITGDITFQPIPKDPRFKDITGQRFGRLTVIGFHKRVRTKNRASFWYCKCDCGNIKSVRAGCLQSKHTQSCGCFSLESIQNRFQNSHQESVHGHKTSVEYTAWILARTRCHNPKYADYKHYGGRGIEFRFDTFEEFLAEVGRRPTNKHSLDRIDVNGHYEKSNIRWATTLEQARNKQKTFFITVGDTKETVAEWAERSKITYSTIYNRLRLGWCGKCAVTAKYYGKCVHIKK